MNHIETELRKAKYEFTLNPKEIGEKIARLRKQSGFDVYEFADLLYVSVEAVAKWESGRGIPAIETLMNVCELLETNLEFLLLSDTKCSVDPLIIDAHYRHDEGWPTDIDEFIAPEEDKDWEKSLLDLNKMMIRKDYLIQKLIFGWLSKFEEEELDYIIATRCLTNRLYESTFPSTEHWGIQHPHNFRNNVTEELITNYGADFKFKLNKAMKNDILWEINKYITFEESADFNYYLGFYFERGMELLNEKSSLTIQKSISCLEDYEKDILLMLTVLKKQNQTSTLMKDILVDSGAKLSKLFMKFNKQYESKELIDKESEIKIDGKILKFINKGNALRCYSDDDVPEELVSKAMNEYRDNPENFTLVKLEKSFSEIAFDLYDEIMKRNFNDYQETRMELDYGTLNCQSLFSLMKVEGRK